MKVLVTVGFWLAFCLTLPFGVVSGALFALVTTPFDPDRRWIHAYICRWCFFFLRLNPGWDIQVEGRANIPSAPCVIVANHQSMADVGVLMGLFRPFKFVSKVSLFRVPLIGWMMRLARYVAIDRGKPHSTQQMLDACRTWLRKGVPVLIFPEGTYSPDGALLPFKRGAFRLAIEEKVPLVPVVVEGTRSLIIGDGPWMSPRSRVRVRVTPPWPPESLGEDETALADRARSYFAAELGNPSYTSR